MKRFLFALLAFSMTSAFAAEVQIFDEQIQFVSAFDTSVDARFQVNTKTGEGFIDVHVSELRWTNGTGYYDQWGRWHPGQPMRMPYTVLKKSVPVEGLALHGDQLIYAAPEGDVNCGRLGYSGVLRRPTIYLSGKCKLAGKVTGHLNMAHVNVTMTTK